MEAREGLVIADWPAPPNIRAVVTTRFLPGASKPPFERFNLGLRSGDDALAVVENRNKLGEMLELPEAVEDPHDWNQQHHEAGAGAASERVPEHEREAARGHHQKHWRAEGPA